jgi:hypothetical protein
MYLISYVLYFVVQGQLTYSPCKYSILPQSADISQMLLICKYSMHLLGSV